MLELTTLLVPRAARDECGQQHLARPLRGGKKNFALRARTHRLTARARRC